MSEMERILELQKKYAETDKTVIAANVKRMIQAYYPDKNYSEVVSKLTETPKKDTVYAWFNLSRKDVKIPFLKLCMIVASMDTTMEEMLK